MATSQPLEQTLRLNDNFTSTLNAIESQLNSTIRTFSRFATVGNQDITLDSNLSKINADLRDLQLSSVDINLSGELEGLRKLESTLEQVYSSYQDEITETNALVMRGTTQIDLQSQRLTLLSQKLAQQQNQLSNLGSSDDSKALDLSLAMNQTQQAIERATQAIQKQEQTVANAQMRYQQLTAEASQYEATLRQAQFTISAIRDSPIVNMDEIRRGVVGIQQLKDEYRAFSADARQRHLLGTVNDLQTASNRAGLLRSMMSRVSLEVGNVNQAVRMGSAYIQGQARMLRSNLMLRSQENGLIGRGSRLLLRVDSTVRKVASSMRRTADTTSSWVAGLGRAGGAAAGVVSGINRASRAQQTLNRMANLLSFDLAIRGLQRLYQMISRVMEVVDQNVVTTARLAFISGDVAENWDKIMNSAQRARASFNDTATFITRMAQNAGDAFGSTDEIIAFTETLNKMYTISGATAQEMSSSMLQLSQAMGQGVLQGQELRSVLQGAPAVAQAIADYMGVATGELKTLGEEGEISADIVRSAILSSIDDVNAKFASMPMTFEQVITQIQNHAIGAFKPIMEQLNAFINSDLGKRIIYGVQQFINVLAVGVQQLMNLIGQVAQWVADNWNLVKMVLVEVLVVVSLLALAFLVTHYRTILIIGALLILAQSFVDMGYTAEEVFVSIVGWMFYIGAIIWDVAVIVSAVIAVIIIYIMMLVKMIILTISTIAGHIGAFVDNVVMGFEYVRDMGVFYFNNFGTLAQMTMNNLLLGVLYLINGIVNMVGTLINNLIQQLATPLEYVNELLTALGQDPISVELPSVGEANLFADTIADLQGKNATLESQLVGEVPSNPEWSSYESNWGNEMRGLWNEGLVNSVYVGKTVGGLLKNPNDARSNGEAWASNVLEGMQNFMNDVRSFDPATQAVNPMDMSDLDLSGMNLGRVDEVGEIKDEVAITEEDLKYLRDIAERQFTVKYNQLTPQATVNYYGAGASSEEDIERLMTRLEDVIEEKNKAYLGG